MESLVLAARPPFLSYRENYVISNLRKRKLVVMGFGNETYHRADILCNTFYGGTIINLISKDDIKDILSALEKESFKSLWMMSSKNQNQCLNILKNGKVLGKPCNEISQFACEKTVPNVTRIEPWTQLHRGKSLARIVNNFDWIEANFSCHHVSKK